MAKLFPKSINRLPLQLGIYLVVLTCIATAGVAAPPSVPTLHAAKLSIPICMMVRLVPRAHDAALYLQSVRLAVASLRG